MTRSSRLAPSASRRERRAQARLDAPPRLRSAHRASGRARSGRTGLLLASLAAGVLGVAAIVLAGGLKPATPAELTAPSTQYAGLIVAGASVGRPDAPVVMQVYADFQCPACKLFVTTELPRLLHDLVVPGVLRIEGQDIEILDRGSGTESLDLAAGASCAADQGRYWQFHDLVFWNQGRENRGDHDAAFIQRIAIAGELDTAAFQACLQRPAVRQAIRDRTASATSAGIASTPTLVINGQSVVGVPDYDQLRALIERLAGIAATPGSKTAP